MLTDFNGTEIKIGDTVRHAYEPWPLYKTPKGPWGYHNHNFGGCGKVIEVFSRALKIERKVGGDIVCLASLCEKIESEFEARLPYIIQCDGPYREPSASGVE